MARFLQQFEMGRGDYTRERESWLAGETVETLADKIRQVREKKEGPGS